MALVPFPYIDRKRCIIVLLILEAKSLSIKHTKDSLNNSFP